MSVYAATRRARAAARQKTLGVHASFPFFVKLCYVWLCIAAVLSGWAGRADTSGGIWGASRHALTVGFLASMILTIGSRVLPAFCGIACGRAKSILAVDGDVDSFGAVLHG